MNFICRLPPFSNLPVLSDYLEKELMVFDPESQYDIVIANKRCPKCKDMPSSSTQKHSVLSFKEYSQPRVVHKLHVESHFINAVYKCSRHGHTVNIMDEALMSLIIPSSLYLYAPMIFNKSAWDRPLVNLMFDMLTSHASASDFVNMVAKARTTTYLKKAKLYRDHVDYYVNFTTSEKDKKKCQKFDDFPRYFTHCEGYNTTHGPSHDMSTSIFSLLVNEQRGFWARYQGGVCGDVIAADHHHNTSERIKMTDESIGRTFQPIEGLFAMMNDQQLISTHRWTNTTTQSEREDMAAELRQRYIDRGLDPDTLQIVVYFDKCCSDSRWFTKYFPMAIILMDNHHLITR